jgi:flagellar hook-length control protein FliK
MGQSDLGKEPTDPFAHLNHVAVKPAAATREVGIEVIDHSQKPSLIETVSTGTPGKSEASGRVDPLKPISSIIDALKQIGSQTAQEKLPPNESSSVIHMASNAQTAKAETQGQHHAGATVQNHPVDSESAPTVKLKNAVQAAMTSNSEPRHADEATRNPTVKNESPLAIEMANNAQTAKAAIRGQHSAGEAVQNHSVQSESSLVSKIIHDAQTTKEHYLRMDSAVGDDIGGKIPRVDVGANDNGLPNPQNQTADKSFEAAFLSSRTEKAQDSLRTQALDQIVRKAVIYIRNGHHEAKIDLKPEFLGHVRLQVTTENQMVTVKILTESGFVKDMVENSIHQLKADLQQQGLNVDKVEVAISSDSDENKQHQEKTRQTKERQRRDAGSKPENRESETQKHPENSTIGPSSTATVDYFA